ncbi:MAG: ATP phosphoribosyltransferase regulatory subunit [Carboxydocellales bacterium]
MMEDNNDLRLRVPIGVKDMLPEEAWRKRQLEQEFAQLFYRWGYQEVVTPTFEFYQALAVAGSNGEQEQNLFKFMDRQGHILALRPDMTTPIARLVATRMKDALAPQRLFYLSNVFSYAEPQVGRQREFFQAGVEFIGSASGDADGEVVALAIEVLKAAGLKNFQLHLGQMAVFKGIMEEIGLEEQQQRRFKSTLANKDFVGMEEILDTSGADASVKDRVRELLALRGGREVLERAGELIADNPAKKGLDNLKEIYAVLENYGVAEYVVIDFSVLRGFEYYTGLIFEGYAQHLGFPICGGGRYDKLLGQWGHPSPATGFAVGLERIMLALDRQGDALPVPAPDVLLVYPKEKRREAIQLAQKYRREGLAVETVLEDSDVEKVRSYAGGRGISRIIEL